LTINPSTAEEKKVIFRLENSHNNNLSVERPPVEENANMNMGGRRPQQQNYQPPEERTTPVNNMNQKQNQPPVFGKEDQKPPQDLSQVKGFETELMNLQMQKDNVRFVLRRLN